MITFGSTTISWGDKTINFYGLEVYPSKIKIIGNIGFDLDYFKPEKLFSYEKDISTERDVVDGTIKVKGDGGYKPFFIEFSTKAVFANTNDRDAYISSLKSTLAGVTELEYYNSRIYVGLGVCEISYGDDARQISVKVYLAPVDTSSVNPGNIEKLYWGSRTHTFDEGLRFSYNDGL